MLKLLFFLFFITAFTLCVAQNAHVKLNRDRSYTLTDPDGNILIITKYDLISQFHKGYSVVRKDDKYGMIDEFANEIAAPKYRYLLGFSEGLSAFSIQKDSFDDIGWGYINKQGIEVIPPIFRYANNFYEDLAAVFDDEKSGYINQKANPNF